MKIEAGFLTAANIFGHAIAGERNAFDLPGTFGSGNNFVTSSIRQANVAHDGVELLRL